MLNFDEPFHQGSISTDAHRKMDVRKRCGFEIPFHVILWMFESSESCFWKRIDVNDVCTVVFCIPQCREHPRMIGSRVLSDDHDHISMIEVIECDGALADADGFYQALSTRFMTHV